MSASAKGYLDIVTLLLENGENPHSVASEYSSFTRRWILLDDKSIIKLAYIKKSETLKAIASFLSEASIIIRCVSSEA